MKRRTGASGKLFRKTKTKLATVMCVVIALLTGCAVSNGELPADFPSDVPIISGEIYRARSARFEDSRGFVVSVLTTLSYEEVVAFYADVVGPRGNGYVLVETTCRDTPTRYVNIAIHLGQGPDSRLPSSFIPDAVQCLHEVRNPPRDVQ